MSIPTIIHQIWLQGAAAMPRTYWAASKTWERRNRGWIHRVWDDGSLCALMNDRAPHWLPLFTAQPEVEARADVGRYALLDLFGGLYADIDTECRRPIGPLLEGSEARLQVTLHLTRSEADDPFRHATNSVIASSPGHPVWSRVRGRIEQNGPQGWVVGRTGPEMLRPILRQFAAENPGDVRLIGYPQSITTFSLPRVVMRLLSRVWKANCVLDFNDSARRAAPAELKERLYGAVRRLLPSR